MEMDFDVQMYNKISDINSCLSEIKIWSRNFFDIVSETLNNCYGSGCLTYIFDPKLQKYGVKITDLDPIIRREINMEFRKMHSTQVGLVLKPMNVSMPLQFHVFIYDMLYTVVSSIETYPEVWISMIMSRKPIIQVMLD